MNNQSSINLFHPLIAKWFTTRYGSPTPVQEQAWKRIAHGDHALICAPTGTGKTLASFLWAIDRLVTGEWAADRTAVLYVSPMRALNNDIQRNLLTPLDEIRTLFENERMHFPDIRVLTRSQDTPSAERRSMAKRPPEVLITTPESLNILLTSKTGRSSLTGISSVILDEIHALFGTRRGTHLITAVERLTLLSGEFQRIALSATINPPESVAAFIGGFRLEKSEAYSRRNVEIIKPRLEKSLSLKVSFPVNARSMVKDGSWWPALAEDFRRIIGENHSTLLFANSRRTAERVARLINEGEDELLAYSHHGSLSKELRLEVERRLKQGELKSIVATSSLELGIDIGELDCVLMVQTPPSVSSALQRIGRSGHGVGDTSRGLIYPTHGRDFLDAAVVARSVIDGDVEPLGPPECPLDVLAQVILSMTCAEEWDIDRLYDFIRTAYPYRELPRRHFDLVIEMLAGRYAGTRLRELTPRVSIDRVDNTIRAKDSVPYLLYLSGGTIPDRGYYDLRIQDTRARIGELDEEFVWERRIGENFAMGAQVWRVVNITHNDVEVAPSRDRAGIIPFWRAEDRHRNFHLSERIALFLEHAEMELETKDFSESLSCNYMLDDAARDELIQFLIRQKESAGIPHRHRIIIEHFDDPANATDRKQVLLHTLWGGKLNVPYAYALAAAWKNNHGYRLEVTANNDSILLMLPHGFNARDVLTMVTPNNIETLLRGYLESTAFFGAAFRESASRALLLPRSSFTRRTPLWLNRLRAKKLMDSVMSFEDFPILLEAWRACLRDEFDLPALKCLLDEVITGSIEINESVTTSPSPFSSSIIWSRTNTYMYADDTLAGGAKSSLTDELIRDIVSSSSIRPKIPEAVVDTLARKLSRVMPGYSPATDDELVEWVKERMLIPAAEWEELLKAMTDDHGETVLRDRDVLSDKLVKLSFPGTNGLLVCAVETAPSVAAISDVSFTIQMCRDVFDELSLPGKKTILRMEKAIAQCSINIIEYPLPWLLRQWLRFYCPLNKSFITGALGIPSDVLDEALAGLSEEGSVVSGLLTEHAYEEQVCDRENMERLLRMARHERMPEFSPLPVEHLALFLADRHGLTRRQGSPEKLQQSIDRLFGYPAPAEAWEEWIFPSRLEPYYTAWTDSLFQSNGLGWAGCGKRRIMLGFPEDIDLFREHHDPESALTEIGRLFPDPSRPAAFFDIMKHTGADSTETSSMLWRAAWNGNVSADSFAVLRKGILNNYKATAAEASHESPFRRSSFNRWSASRPIAGTWRAFPGEYETDALIVEEMNRERVRFLFDRYGVLFREITLRESEPLQWRSIFRTLRLMELSGEALSGYFFRDVPGLQFVTHESLRALNSTLPHDAVWWVNATDPVSLCGMQIERMKELLPPRVKSNWIVYRGSELVMTVKRNGRDVLCYAESGDPLIPGYCRVFRDIVSREFNPVKSIHVETINGEPADKCEYAKPFVRAGFSVTYKGLELRKKY